MIGKIETNKHFLTEHVGTATGTVNGKEVKVDILVGGINKSPILQYKNKHFVLSWDDILELAEQAGLFKDDESKEEGAK